MLFADYHLKYVVNAFYLAVPQRLFPSFWELSRYWTFVYFESASRNTPWRTAPRRADFHGLSASKYSTKVALISLGQGRPLHEFNSSLWVWADHFMNETHGGQLNTQSTSLVKQYPVDLMIEFSYNSNQITNLKAYILVRFC